MLLYYIYYMFSVLWVFFLNRWRFVIVIVHDCVHVSYTVGYEIVLYHIVLYSILPITIPHHIMYHIWYNIMQKNMIQYYSVPETFYVPIFSYVRLGLTYALRSVRTLFAFTKRSLFTQRHSLFSPFSLIFIRNFGTPKWKDRSLRVTAKR